MRSNENAPHLLYIDFLSSIREAGFQPLLKLRKGDFAVGAFVALCHRLILPLFEIGLFNLPYTHTGGIALIILLIQYEYQKRFFDGLNSINYI